MSVMENLRSGTDSTFMQVILGLVVVSFVFWYAAPQGDKAAIIATVNGEPILDTEFYAQFREAEARQGRPLQDDERAQLRERVRQNMIEEEVLLQEADRLGLQVSEREIARQLLMIPRFQTDGKFDRDKYARALRGMGYTQSVFEDNIRKDLLREKLRRLVFLGASISEPILREAYVDKETRIDISYVRVRAPVFYDSIEPTPEEIETVLTERMDEVTDQYNKDLSRKYDLPTKVTLKVLRLQKLDDGEDEVARIEALKAEAEAGADFAELARKWSEDPSADNGGDMGAVSLTELAPEVQGVMSDADGNPVMAGQITRPVQTVNDVRIFKVEAREEGRVIPMDEVENDIAKRLLAEEQAPTKAVEFAEKTLAAWTEKGSPPEVDITAQRLAVSQTGPIPLEGQPGPFSPPADMVAAAKGKKAGDVLPEVYEKDGVFWIGQLTDIQDADMDLYEDERDTIREQVLLERRVAFYQDWVADAKKRATIE